jgi:hypothetical protein
MQGNDCLPRYYIEEIGKAKTTVSDPTGVWYTGKANPFVSNESALGGACRGLIHQPASKKPFFFKEER